MRQRDTRLKITSRITDLSPFTPSQDNTEPENIELWCEGVIRDRADTLEISYEESSQLGMDGCVTTLIFEKNRPDLLSMNRSGKYTAGLTFSGENRIQKCLYSVGNSPFEFSINTRSIKNTMTYDGGKIELDYIIEFSGEQSERSELKIEAPSVGKEQ